MKLISASFASLALSLAAAPVHGQVIVDHRCTKLARVPLGAIDAAKKSLHIAYGHTSHGSQVTTGMTGLVGFSRGVGGPRFAWNNGGTNGALDLHDRAMGGDVGYYPQWVNNTRNYLNNPGNKDVNVIIWSWCGQHSGYTQQMMIDRYLAPMAKLETEYPQVKFVYMTGHVYMGSLRANTNARNQQIRDFCIKNKKILYDFADIESWDPDGTFYPYVNDNCDYFDQNGRRLGNWAENWQRTHLLNVDWYSCSSAHSKPLNANQKAYAVWWLWARLAGWSGPDPLTRDRHDILVSRGGPLNFYLDASSRYAGRGYLLLGSASGITPGIRLPGGQATLPLNADPLMVLVLSCISLPPFQGFLGKLDAQGQARATMNLGPLPVSLIGANMHFAYALFAPWDFASNAVPLKISR